jgi:hypothetical protein
MKTLLIAIGIGLAIQAPRAVAAQHTDVAGVDAELHTRMQELTARAVAALETLENLSRRLRRQGLTLRPEVVTQRVRLESSLDDAEAALKDHRDKDARRAIMRGEGAAAKIEAFLQGK